MKKIKIIIIVNILIILLFFVLPFNRLFSTSYYYLLKIIFVVYSGSLLYILYLILRQKMKQNEFIKKNFKSLFLFLSIIAISLSGAFHIGYLKVFVVPDLIYCDYYDDYNNKLYSSVTGCPKMKDVKVEYENNELSYLSYKINGDLYKRYYENQKIKKTVQTSFQDNLIELNEGIVPFNTDYKIIETNYYYEENQFKQTKTISYYANDSIVLEQNGFYESNFYIVKKVNLYVDIEKNLETKIIATDNELKTIIDSSEEMRALNLSLNQLISSIKYQLQKKGQLNKTYSFHGSKYSTTYHFYSHIDEGKYQNPIANIYFKDPQYDAWHSTDSSINYGEIDKTFNYKDGFTSESYNKTYPEAFNITCHSDQVTYCDSNYRYKKLYFRHLIKIDHSIKKVETYYLIGKNILTNDKKISLKNEIHYLDFLPFDDYVNRHELLETPKPYIEVVLDG